MADSFIIPKADIRSVQPRTALWVAIACGGAAVGLVSLDVAFNVVVRVDAETDGAWVTVATTRQDAFGGSRPGGFGDCIEERFRLVVENNRPIEATLDVWVRQDGPNGTVTLLQDTWVLPRFSSQQETLELRPADDAAWLNVQVGDQYLYPCVRGKEGVRPA